MRGARGGVGVCYVLLVRCGARWCARLQATVALATTATRHGTGELRPWWKMELGDGNGGGEHGERSQSSQQSRGGGQRARGGPGDGESTGEGSGARG